MTKGWKLGRNAAEEVRNYIPAAGGISGRTSPSQTSGVFPQEFREL